MKTNIIFLSSHKVRLISIRIWASTRENLPLGLSWNFACSKCGNYSLRKAKNKAADQTAQRTTKQSGKTDPSEIERTYNIGK